MSSPAGTMTPVSSMCDTPTPALSPGDEGVEEEGGGGAGAGVEVNISIGIFTGVFRHTALGRLNTGESCIITI